MKARLNREAGANPAQSRYCNGEGFHKMSLGNYPGRREALMNLSQETCLFFRHRDTYER